MTDLCFMTARELRAALGRREVSAREVVQAHLSQIDGRPRTSTRWSRLVPGMDLAAADERAAWARTCPRCTACPMAHKDVHETAGIRTTYRLTGCTTNSCPRRTTWSSSGCAPQG